jgi:Putative adhesin
MPASLLALLLGIFGGNVTVQQHLTFSAGAAPTVRIESTNGAINLKTGGTRVDVVATKSADTQEKVDALKVSSSQNGGTVTVRAIFPQPCNSCGSIAFDVTVPAGTKVELATTNGSIGARGLSADTKLTTTNGSIGADFASAGSVRSVVIESTNGSVTLALPSSAKLGRVHADAMVGHISSDWNLNVNRTNVVGANVDQTLLPGGLFLNISTTTGSISIRKS